MDDTAFKVLFFLAFFGAIGLFLLLLLHSERALNLRDLKLRCRFGFHEWIGCICKRCRLVKQDATHDWVGCKCTVCGLPKRDGPHQWIGCNCKSCGMERHEWDEGGVCPNCRRREAGLTEPLVVATPTGTQGWVWPSTEFEFTLKSWSGRACRVEGSSVSMMSHDPILGVHYHFRVSVPGKGSFSDDTYAQDERDLVRYIRDRIRRAE